jgi:hypothetical protein
MRSSQLITGALAIAATSSLVGLGSTAQAATAEPTVTHENGVVVECRGTWRHRDVYASLYENNLHGNVVQVVVDDGRYAASRQPKREPVVGDQVRTRVRLGGTRAVVKGLARLDGTRTHVSEVLDDAGQTVESTGVQRGLDTDIAFHWRDHAAKLDCSGSFRYRLTVTRTPIA